MLKKKAKERKSVLAEARKLKFRDDAMIADAKSRFSEITDEIDLDANLFIKAVKDAIEAERSKGSGAPTKPTPTPKPTPVVDELDKDVDNEPPFDVDEFDDEESNAEYDFEAIRNEIKNKARAQKKTAEVKEIMVEAGYKKIDEVEDIEILTKMMAVFE